MQRPKLGINVSEEVDANDLNGAFDLFDSVRVFHAMDKDYPENSTPSEAKPDAPLTGWGRMNNGALRWNKLPIYLDLTVTLQHYENKQNGRWTQGFWLSNELGETRIERVNAGFEYGMAFFRLYDGICDRLHIANEAWDKTIGYKALADWTNGILLAHKYSDSNIKLSLPCMRYDGEKYGKDYIEHLLLDVMPYDYDIDIHLYSFRQQPNRKISYTLTDIPESKTSDFKHIYDTLDYRYRNLPNSKIISSEQGYDSHTVGEVAQAAYSVRHYLLLWSLGVYQVDFYELSDNPYKTNTLYATSGFRESEGNNRIWGRKKLIWTVFERLKSTLEGCYFVKSWQKENFIFHEYEKQALQESKNEEIANAYIVAWKVSEIEKTDNPSDLLFDEVAIDFEYTEIIDLLDYQRKDCDTGKVQLSALPTIFKINKQWQRKSLHKKNKLESLKAWICTELKKLSKFLEVSKS